MLGINIKKKTKQNGHLSLPERKIFNIYGYNKHFSLIIGRKEFLSYCEEALLTLLA